MVNKYLEQLKNGILTQNPTFVQLLGMCPTLATTTSVVNALGMGLATTVVLTFSNLFISLVRKIIPKEVRIASYIVIISGFVTAVELLIKAYLPETPMKVIAACCAGVTPASHEAALTTMKMCQVEVL